MSENTDHYIGSVLLAELSELNKGYSRAEDVLMDYQKEYDRVCIELGKAANKLLKGD